MQKAVDSSYYANNSMHNLTANYDKILEVLKELELDSEKILFKCEIHYTSYKLSMYLVTRESYA